MVSHKCTEEEMRGWGNGGRCVSGGGERKGKGEEWATWVVGKMVTKKKEKKIGGNNFLLYIYFLSLKF